jgi:hypothetical protein
MDQLSFISLSMGRTGRRKWKERKKKREWKDKRKARWE